MYLLFNPTVYTLLNGSVTSVKLILPLSSWNNAGWTVYVIFGMSCSLRFSHQPGQSKAGCGEQAEGLILPLAAHQALLQPAHWPLRHRYLPAHTRDSSRAQGGFPPPPAGPPTPCQATHRRLPLAQGPEGCSYLRDWRMAFMKQVLPRFRRPVAHCAMVLSCVVTLKKIMDPEHSWQMMHSEL